MKRNIDEVGFKTGRAAEKATERNVKRKIDEISFKTRRTAERATERNVKRKIDAIGFKTGQAAEKAKQRNIKKGIDEDGFKKGRAAETAKIRNAKKEQMKSEISRRKLFFRSVREGPIYGCICCQRIRFKKGVVEFDKPLEKRISKHNCDIIDKAVGIPKKEFLVGKSFYICLDCEKKLLQGKMPTLSHKNKLGMVDISHMKELCLTELEYLVPKICPASKI